VCELKALLRRLMMAVFAMAIGGCSLDVTPFVGTTIVLDIAGASATRPGEHLELWGRNNNNDIFRVSYRLQDNELRGFSIRPALQLEDPCSINDTGYLLTDSRAYPMSQLWGGVVQTPEEQAIQALTRIKQLTSVADGGIQPSTLLAMTPYDETPPPMLSANVTGAERHVACQAYWAASPYSYSGNPFSWGAPLHGSILGAIDYTTSLPQQRFSDIALTSPFDLRDLVEVWFTREQVPPNQVDPLRRGPVWMLGTRVPDFNAGRGATNFELTGDGVSGTMSLIFPEPQSL
jgi:hypothetical protein